MNPLVNIPRLQTYFVLATGTGWQGRLLRGSGWSATAPLWMYSVKLSSLILVATILSAESFGKLG